MLLFHFRGKADKLNTDVEIERFELYISIDYEPIDYKKKFKLVIPMENLLFLYLL